ncbi:MATE family efflux transporter [Rariglobus hedericola]|uniref:Multidrug-efflux transporter n=1 Tax=Rariglobus hedericola TaxID=2597822 RepID=A0A556QIW2_9BACT|nr:MATE family efflux transporter [Rariglobus hedericola]TSJ76580.1 MATE family efflux transporter [Rariglobus hedericola]
MSVYFREARATLRLALPIIVGQVSQMLMGVTDSVMIGRLGAVPLAASAFASGVFSVFFVVGLGLLLPVAVLVSREHGASDDQAGARWLQHGVALGVIAGLVEFALMLGLMGWFHRLGQPPEVLAAVNPFYVLITASILPTLVFQVFRQFAEALGRPWVPMFIMLGGVALNVVLNWVLIYGHWGAPALGLAGAGWATLASRVIVVVAIILWLRRATGFRSAWPDTWWRGLQARRFREMLVIGVPAAVMLFFEVGAFMMAALMMGWIGAEALAAHQIALSCAAFMFMFPLGISMAVGMRVGKAVGEGRHELLRPIATGGLVTAIAIMSVSAIGFAVFGPWLAGGFVNDPGVVALAAKLLVVAAIFQLFDGAQVIGSGALRGLADVRVPATISFIAYWLLAIPGGYLLGLHTSLGAVGIWVGLAVGLAIAAVLLAARFLRLTK